MAQRSSADHAREAIAALLDKNSNNVSAVREMVRQCVQTATDRSSGAKPQPQALTQKTLVTDENMSNGSISNRKSSVDVSKPVATVEDPDMDVVMSEQLSPNDAPGPRTPVANKPTSTSKVNIDKEEQKILDDRRAAQLQCEQEVDRLEKDLENLHVKNTNLVHARELVEFLHQRREQLPTMISTLTSFVQFTATSVQSHTAKLEAKKHEVTEARKKREAQEQVIRIKDTLRITSRKTESDVYPTDASAERARNSVAAIQSVQSKKRKASGMTETSENHAKRTKNGDQ